MKEQGIMDQMLIGPEFNFIYLIMSAIWWSRAHGIYRGYQTGGLEQRQERRR